MEQHGITETDRILALRDAGWSIKRIAADIHRHQTFVAACLKANGRYIMNKAARIPDDADPAVRFILENYRSEKDRVCIAIDSGVNPDTIRRWSYRDYNAKIKTIRRILKAKGKDLAIVDLNPQDAEPSIPSSSPGPVDRRRALRMAEDAGRFHERLGL